MLLTGSYRRSLDEKGRLALPKQLRDVLGFPEKSSLFITPGTDQSLAIYTEEVLEQLGETLAENGPVTMENRAFSRLFYAQAQPAEIDRQGRLRIPPELAKISKLKSDVVVLGVRNHLEIWDHLAWEQFLEQTQPQYDQLAVRALTRTPAHSAEPADANQP